MYDKELAIEILNQILQASLTVISRFEPISGVSDFTASERCLQLHVKLYQPNLTELSKLEDNPPWPFFPQ